MGKHESYLWKQGCHCCIYHAWLFATFTIGMCMTCSVVSAAGVTWTPKIIHLISHRKGVRLRLNHSFYWHNNSNLSCYSSCSDPLSKMSVILSPYSSNSILLIDTFHRMIEDCPLRWLRHFRQNQKLKSEIEISLLDYTSLINNDLMLILRL